MGMTVQASDGAMLPLDSLPCQFAYDGGFISTLTVQYSGKTYVQTFLNNGSNIIYISGWVNPDLPQSFQVMTDESDDPMVDENGEIMTTESI